MARYICTKELPGVKQKFKPPIGSVVAIRLKGSLKYNTWPYEIIKSAFPLSVYDVENCFRELRND